MLKVYEGAQLEKQCKSLENVAETYPNGVIRDLTFSDTAVANAVKAVKVFSFVNFS